MKRPWGVHAIGDIYHPDVQAVLPDGRWVAAVAEPYTAGTLRAAWWVLTGKAFAFTWPKAGDLENIWLRKYDPTQPTPGRPFVPAACLYCGRAASTEDCERDDCGLLLANQQRTESA